MEDVAYTMREAADASRISRTRLYAAVANGDLVVRKMGRRTIVLKADLMRYLNALPAATGIKDHSNSDKPWPRTAA